MDITKLLKNINSVDEYISATQEVTDKCKNTKVQFNLSTVLALKKLKSLEVEYLNKCYENGAACIVFERLLALPPSKTWGVLAKELVSLLQYWLDAVRKYLLTHNHCWWNFLKLILTFIKEIRLKDPTIPDILVELTAECLFDIATRDTPNAYQRHDILHGLNVFCAESSREIRFAMRTKLGDYFTGLATLLARCGYLPCQYVSLEALVRWLVPRNDSALRAAVAKRWFPPDLCPESATEVFLNSGWMNFFQDARKFLNPLNKANGLVTSVICRRLTIGNILIISGAEKQQTWLDINSTGKSISILLDPRVLETFGVLDHRACETLLITEDNTEFVKLHSESGEVVVSVQSYLPPRVQPAGMPLGERTDVTIAVSTRTRLETLDAALRDVFGDKYHLLLNLDSVLSLSPSRSHDTKRNKSSSEEDARFSHPVEVKRRPHSGYVVRSKHAGGLVSPSTASTTSLAQLHDKLEALPRFKYDKELVSICAQPQLSSVTEISESDDKSFHSAATLKIRHYGVSTRNLNFSREQLAKPTKKKADSDSETIKLRPRLQRHLSPIISEDDATSCLLVATIGSNCDSVINDTLERLAKSKQLESDNIVDLLVQEALDAKPPVGEENIHSGKIICDTHSEDNEINSEAIENTPIQNDAITIPKTRRLSTKKICTVVSKSTTDDESNTEVVNETTCLVNAKNNTVNQTLKERVESNTDFDVQEVENFFSQHITENKRGDIVISPSLARKINRSSSDTSENIDENFLIITESLNDNIDIVECLNDMLDKVCSDFKKCAAYFNDNAEDLLDNQTKILQATCFSNQLSHKSGSEAKPKRQLKLTYKAKMEKKTSKKGGSKKKQTNMNQITKKKMSTILEQNVEDQLTESETNENAKISSKEITSPKENNLEMSLIKKKRKLYSPKDDEIEKENKAMNLSDEEEDDIVLSKFKSNKTKPPISAATCYKELEQERKHIRLPRSRRSRIKVVSKESPSPRTLKMDAVFDNLISTVESSEKFFVVNNKTAKSTIYNFTSDSEDENFVKKTMERKKRTKVNDTKSLVMTTTSNEDEDFMKNKSERQKRSKVADTESSVTTTTRKSKRNKRTLYSEKTSNDEVTNVKPVRRKKALKKCAAKSKTNVDIESHINLVDERMRDADPDISDSSIVIEKPKITKAVEVQVEIHEPPKMELIPNDHEKTVFVSNKPNSKINKTNSISVQKDKLQLMSDKDEDKTASPLPGLVVETVPTYNENANDSFSVKLLQKMKEICNDEVDPAANDESYNTQNMLLSDIEGHKNGFQNAPNVEEEICFVDHINIRPEMSKSIKWKKTLHQQNEVTYNSYSINNNNIRLDEDVNENIEIKSTTSIETNGITAHGDLDEAPPGPELILKSMQPREIVDLNQSLQDYFVNLNRGINYSSSNDRRKSSAESTEMNKIENNLGLKSPVVQIERLPFNDISKWLSPTSSKSKVCNKSSPKINEFEKSYKEPKSNHIKRENQEAIKTHKTSSRQKMQTVEQENKQLKSPIVNSPKLQSPIDPGVPLSLEEFDKWLPMPKCLISNNKTNTSSQKMPKQNIKLVYNTRQNSKTLKDINNFDVNKEKTIEQLTPKTTSTKLADKNQSKKYTSSKRSKQDSDNISDLPQDTAKNEEQAISTAKQTTSKITSDTSENDSVNEPVLYKDTSHRNRNKSTQGNKTVISPIIDFENFVAKKQSDTESNDGRFPIKSKKTLYKMRVNSKKIGKYISSKTSVRSVASDTSMSKEIKNTDFQKSRYPSRSSRLNKLDSTSTNTKEIVRLDTSSSNTIKEVVRVDSTSTNLEETIRFPIKRKSPLFCEPKKMRVEADIEKTIVSEPSVSSVKDWLRSIESTKIKADESRLTFKDTLQNIMEKLDTTIDEINQNTSKKFVNLFMETQQKLLSRQEERRNMYKNVATEIIAQMVSTINDKFTEINQRSQEMDVQFKEELKKQSVELIREDCKQKRAMVSMLKEDIKAVLDNIELNKSDSS